MSDDLDRFVEAQSSDYGSTYADALREIRAGLKTSAWMWYVFPQLRGLGTSELSHRYGIADLDEAKAYLAHPVLGPRLIEISKALLQIEDKDALMVMGYPNDLKLKSCMTLFAMASDGEPVFQEVLDAYFGGERDEKTLGMLH